jgi:methionyl-tRNA formyltransferase
MRVLFLGTPDFAVATLVAINESQMHDVVGVVTVPDRPAGRGRKLRPSAVATKAVELGIPTLKPEKLRDEAFLESVKQLEPDVAVVVAFRMMPEVLWSLPPHGTFNIHASLLPDYRGAAPINWAIMNGDTKTGVTSFLLDHQIDTGKVLLQLETPIGENETAGEVHDRLMEMGAQLAVKTLDGLEHDHLSPMPQEKLTTNRKLHHAPKIFKPDTVVQTNQPAKSIHDFIRGLSPYPGAILQCRIDNSDVDVKIIRTKRTEIPTDKKEVFIEDGKLFIPASDELVQVEELQFPGKRSMAAESFLAGWKGATSWTVRNA